jgi:prolipoprotein diacylglyceryl transferase
VFRSAIPTPTSSVLELGPFAFRAYALTIIVGVALAIWLGNRRFVAAFPEARGVVSDVAIVAVPAGIIGGRIYHVISSPQQYFGRGGEPLGALKIWQGGLGIWGAISLGAVGAWLAYRHLAKSRELPQFRYFLDALAPGILFAQAIGRWGNWFNGELFGRPTDLPWALEIPLSLRPTAYRDFETFHPTFLYESLWCLALGLILLKFSSRFAGGQIFALYIVGYCIGRLGFEALRIDEANLIFGLRLNIFVSLLVGIGAAATFQRFSKHSR